MKKDNVNQIHFLLVFLTSNILLSYFDLSLEAKLLVVFLGLVVPACFFLSGKYGLSMELGILKGENSGRSISPWLWGLVFLLGCFLRFYKLTSLSTWPYSDEGVYAFGALELSQNGIWHFLYTEGQHPPLFSWALGLFFKVFQPSLFSLWFFPALFSSFTLLLAYWAGRETFSKPFALIYLVLIATGFWPQYVGRIANNEMFSSFWEFLTLWILVLLLKNASKPSAWLYALVLGFCAGAGIYTFVVWLAVTIAVSLVVVFSREIKGRKILLSYFIPVTGLTLLFFILYFADSHGEAIRMRWAVLPGMDWKQQAVNLFNDLSTVFWGCPEFRYIDYGPVWGGLLNPILGSFFMLGLLRCCGQWQSPFVRWLLGCLFLFILPALLTNGMETFRIVYLLPFLFIVSAVGINDLASALKKPAWKIVGMVLVFSFFLDFFHLHVIYHSIWGVPGPRWSYLKSIPECEAYQRLDRDYRQTGPGIILSDLRPISYDQTLMVGANPFDAAHNPRIPFQTAKWTALLASTDYEPFLSARFPDMVWYEVGKEHAWDSVDWALGVIPITAGNQETMKHWLKANDGFRVFTTQWMDRPLGSPLDPLYARFLQSHELVAGDAFLESCFWEKMIFFHWAVQKDRPKTLEAIDQYLKCGYPSPRILKLKKDILGIVP